MKRSLLSQIYVAHFNDFVRNLASSYEGLLKAISFTDAVLCTMVPIDRFRLREFSFIKIRTFFSL